MCIRDRTHITCVSLLISPMPLQPVYCFNLLAVWPYPKRHKAVLLNTECTGTLVQYKIVIGFSGPENCPVLECVMCGKTKQ